MAAIVSRERCVKTSFRWIPGELTDEPLHDYPSQRWLWVGVTKAPIINFSVSKIFDLAKYLLDYFSEYIR